MECLNCKKKLIKGQKKYCSIYCQKEFEYNTYIQNWKDGLENGLIGKSQLSARIRKYMLDKTNYKCELCGWGELNPFSNSIPLEIHHIDGDYKNNNENNLQVLCPNCHSLTSNYKSLNKNGREDRTTIRKNYCIDCGIEITNEALRCHSCEAKTRITAKPIDRIELKQLIRNKPFTIIGEQFGVTDNAIRKWCKQFDLPTRKKDINNFTDEEWELL